MTLSRDQAKSVLKAGTGVEGDLIYAGGYLCRKIIRQDVKRTDLVRVRRVQEGDTK
jgi:hypothetical protein